MADQYSARPSGGRVPGTRQGRVLSTAELNWQKFFASNKRRLMAFTILLACTHILLVLFTAQDHANSFWPTLALIYALLFTTITMLSNHMPRRFAQSVPLLPLPTLDFSASKADHSLPQRSAPQGAHSFNRRSGSRRYSLPNLHPAKSCLERRDDWTDLMSQVSHELRTPLNAMIGFSDAMHAEVLGPLNNPQYREYLSHIRQSGQELLKSAEDTLAMTGLLASHAQAEPSRQATHLASVFAEVTEQLALEAITKSVTIKLATVSDVFVHAEKRALRQAVLNILSQAIAVADSHSEVTVCTYQTGDLVEIDVTCQAQDAEFLTVKTTLKTSIAEVLLNLLGTTLVVSVNQSGAWQASTLLECRLQSDFFDEAASHPHS